MRAGSWSIFTKSRRRPAHKFASLSVVPCDDRGNEAQHKQEIIAGCATTTPGSKRPGAGNPEYDNWFNKPINNAKLKYRRDLL